MKTHHEDEMSERHTEEDQEQLTAKGVNDSSMAQAFVSDHLDTIRSTPESGGWLVWEGTYWKPDALGEVTELLRDFTMRTHADFDGMADEFDDRLGADSKKAKKTRKIANQIAAYLNTRKLRDAVAAAQTMREVRTPLDRLNADAHLLATASGTVDLRTGRLKPADPFDLITKQTDVPYDPDAECPRFMQFLDEITDGDEELQEFLQRVFGYGLTAYTRDQVIFIFVGDGSNGKDTLLNAVMHPMGGYAGRAAPGLIAQKQHDGHPADIADLFGLRLALHSELPAGGRIAEARVKEFTGSERLKARYMRQDFFEFENTATHFLLSNHLPRLQGDDHGIRRRLVIVPFPVRVAPEDQDTELGDKLRAEAPGILRWMIEGAVAWQRAPVGVEFTNWPDAVSTATAEFRKTQNPVEQFMAQATAQADDPDALVWVSDLHNDFRAWALLNAPSKKDMNSQAFGKALAALEYEKGPKSRKAGHKNATATLRGLVRKPLGALGVM